MNKCRYSAKCGGCVHMGKKYSESLEYKQKMIEKLIRPFCKVNKIIRMDEPYFYRNKVHAVVGGDRKGNIYAGTYEAGSHKIVPIDKCLLDNEKADAIIATVIKLMKSFKYRPYNEDTGRGFLRHILIRTAEVTGEIMVTLVVGENIFPSKSNFIKALTSEHPEITTIVMNVNSKRTSMVLGEKEETLYGKGYIEDILCGKRFRISSKSFYQVNHEQTEKLYNIAIGYAALTGKENVFDAYSGIGTIGICASDNALSVTGVELNRDAVKDALTNCKLNNLKNVKFMAGDAGEHMEKEAASGRKYDVVFMDPPRSGSSLKFINSVCKMAPSKVVYISCGPESLARDLQLFKKKGYRIVECQPVDMFGWTGHVETVVLLSKGAKGPVDLCSARTEVERRMVDSRKVEVDFSLEDMDLSEFMGKATYEQIKAYVLEQTGLKVSSLYIAQIKKKCGLDVGENFNLPESENARQPQCTPEKEEAIMQAFKHFGIV